MKTGIPPAAIIAGIVWMMMVVSMAIHVARAEVAVQDQDGFRSLSPRR